MERKNVSGKIKEAEKLSFDEKVSSASLDEYVNSLNFFSADRLQQDQHLREERLRVQVQSLY